MKLLFCHACLMAALLAGCGSSPDEPALDIGSSPETTPAPRDRCLSVSRPAIRAINDSFNVAASIDEAAAVKSSDEGPLAGYRRTGLYFFAASLKGGGLDDTVAVWAVSGDFLKTGGGLVIAADGFANEFSNAGDLADEDALGLGHGSDGFVESRDCLD